MKTSFSLFMVLLMLILTGCGRSKETTLYLLNPVPSQKNHLNTYSHLAIGIDRISTPAYLDRPQILLKTSSNRLKLAELFLWAERLDKNIWRIVETNLTSLLPGAIVKPAPWDSKFIPNYHLQLSISQFEIDATGKSILRVESLIYSQDELKRRLNTTYVIHNKVCSLDALIKSMNTNLTSYTQDLARALKQLKGKSM